MLESFINIFTILNLTILSTLLWLKKDSLASNKFLAIVIFSPAGPFFLNYLIYTGFIKNYPWLMLGNIANLWAPAISFYVKSLFKKEFRWQTNLWHLIPQVNHMAVWAFVILRGKSYRDTVFDNVFMGNLPWEFDFFNAILMMQCLGYLSYSILIIRAQTSPDNFTFKKAAPVIIDFIKGVFKSNHQNDPLQEWLHQFIGLAIGINMLFIVLGFIIPRDLVAFVYIPGLYNIIYFLIVYKSFKYSALFNSIAKEKQPRYSHSPLSEKQSYEYYQKIINIFNEEKLYLDCDLKIEDVAEKLTISTLFISQAINQNEEKNFFEFVNTYRVNEAKRLLTDTTKSELTIEAIAFDSGFGSKATFNRIFKKHTGITPSEYVKEISNSTKLISNLDAH